MLHLSRMAWLSTAPPKPMNFIIRHWLPVSVVAFVAYSTAIDSMDEPTPADSKLYRWFYRFAHAFAFNLITAFGKIGRTPWPGEVEGEAWPPPSGPAQGTTRSSIDTKPLPKTEGEPWPPSGTH